MAFTRIVVVSDSSQIQKIGFDPENRKMFVNFANGTIYDYTGITAELFGKLVGADSVGQFFSLNIRFNHKGVKR